MTTTTTNDITDDGSIVQCDGCGTHGRRAANAASPDFWYYLQSTDRTFGKGGVYVVWACSEKCRDSLWRRGPGRGLVDDEATLRRRRRDARRAKREVAQR